MKIQIPDSLLTSLRAYLLADLGLDFSEKHEKELVRKMEHAALAFGYDDLALFIEWVTKNKLTGKQVGDLASHLTIGETYFFREKKSFDFLEQIYLPGLILKRYGAERRLRVWCAGCATGEEAYSLAIALFQSIPEIADWNISILATDINRAFLEKARKGIYTQWSFRGNAEEEFINKYFTRVGKNECHILPEIKKMVTFSSLNLAGDHYPSPANNTQFIDIIFCRNVLIYFSPEGNQAVTNRFYKALVNGGILIVSPVEMTGLISPKFSKINYSGFTIYQKDIHREKVQAFDKAEIPLQKLVPSISDRGQKKDHPARLADQPEFIHLKQLLREGKSPEPSATKEAQIENEISRVAALFEKGHIAEAEALLTMQKRQMAINDKHALFLLAKTEANLGKLKEAEDLCREILSLDKLDPKLYYLLGTIMQEQGNDAMAISSLKRALYLDPDFVLANFLLGTLSLKMGNKAAGKKSFENALSSLKKFPPTDILPESDGLTAGRFQEIINSITS